MISDKSYTELCDKAFTGQVFLSIPVFLSTLPHQVFVALGCLAGIIHYRYILNELAPASFQCGGFYRRR